MSGDGGGFLSRWSRRKRAAVVAPPPAAAGPAPPAEAVPAPGAAAPAFDPASLPPVESLTSGSDFAAFLRDEVPAALRRAALRRAWALDPAIRDFVGPADYAWDFNAPDGMPGFSLTLGGDVKRLLAQAIGLEEPPDDGAAEEAESLSVAVAEAPAAGSDAVGEVLGARPLLAPTAGGAAADAPAAAPLPPVIAEAPGAEGAVSGPSDARPAREWAGQDAAAEAPAALLLSTAAVAEAAPETERRFPDARPAWTSAVHGAGGVAGALAAEPEGAGAAGARPEAAPVGDGPPVQAPETPAARRRHGGALPS